MDEKEFQNSNQPKIEKEDSKVEKIDMEQESAQAAPKKIEVVTGDGALTISPVYEHLEVEKPKPKENRKIFIPEVKGHSTKTKEKNVENNNNEYNTENSTK